VRDKTTNIGWANEWEPSIVRTNQFAELKAFIAVAEERSFRRAAARLDLTPSTLSHSLRSLEETLEIRLLNRTTRNVSLTEAGETLLRRVAPAFGAIEAAVEGVNEFSDTLHGTIRINVPLMAAHMVLAPMFGAFARAYPRVTLEVAVNDATVDVVKQGFDAGIRFGESLQQDMIAVPVSPQMRIAVVGSPDYFERNPPPKTPNDLHRHQCIGFRAITSGTLYRWDFDRDGREFSVQVTGPLVVDTHELMVSAALDGVGLGYATESVVRGHLATGRLIRVLEKWCAPFPGFYLYYPGRRHVPMALRALIDTIRYKSTASG
jgi:DNA-binding transcriptional LysR family regulator